MEAIRLQNQSIEKRDQTEYTISRIQKDILAKYYKDS